LAFGPYRRTGPAVAIGPVLAGGALFVGACDGRVHRLDVDTGAAEVVADVGAPITAPLLALGDRLLVASADGWLETLPI
jgi:outer membrane protein assembly factor BamB